MERGGEGSGGELYQRVSTSCGKQSWRGRGGDGGRGEEGRGGEGRGGEGRGGEGRGGESESEHIMWEAVVEREGRGKGG